jgi:hypothetical protein
MTKRFLTGLNLANLESDPDTGSEGDLYFNTSFNSIKLYTDNEWTFLNTSASAGVIDGGGPDDF